MVQTRKADPNKKTTGFVSDKKLTRFVYSRILVLVLTALLFAGLLISVANDMYAFVKPDRSVTLSVDAPLPLSELAVRLEKSGILYNPFVFQLYTKSKGKAQLLESFVGTLELNSAMSYRDLLLAFSDGTH